MNASGKKARPGILYHARAKTIKKGASKRFLPLAAALTILFALSACGGNATSAHDFTFTSLSGNQYSGTYTGDWENGRPHGDGSFTGEGEKGQLTLVGSWTDGQPNGQCGQTFNTGTSIKTYNGDYFYGEVRGTGDLRIEDLDGNLLRTYSGEFRDGNFSGEGETTYYYTEEQAAESGYARREYVGQFADGNPDGEGKWISYFTEERAGSLGVDYTIFSGQYSDGKANGNMELLRHSAEEYAAEKGIDYEVLTGLWQDGSCVGSLRYAFYKDNEVIEEGTYKDGTYISDTEKAIKDGIYDIVRGAAGDGIVGDLIDIFGPAVYDRYGD